MASKNKKEDAQKYNSNLKFKIITAMKLFSQIFTEF